MEPTDVKEEIAHFFEELYSSEDIVRPTWEGIAFASIQEDLKIWLERSFEEEEVSKALADCAGDKAPGLDGFNVTFIKAAWDVL